MRRGPEPRLRSTPGRARGALLVLWETPAAGVLPGHRPPRGEHLQRMPCALSRDYRRGGAAPGLVLRSLNAVTKNTPIMTMILGRAAPDPGRGSPVELGRRDTCRLLDFLGVAKLCPANASRRKSRHQPS